MVKASNKTLAWKFSVWCWGKVIPNEVSELEAFFNRFLDETGIILAEDIDYANRPEWLSRTNYGLIEKYAKDGQKLQAVKMLRDISRDYGCNEWGLKECKNFIDNLKLS